MRDFPCWLSPFDASCPRYALNPKASPGVTVVAYCRGGNHRSVAFAYLLQHVLIAQTLVSCASTDVICLTDLAGQWSGRKCGRCSVCRHDRLPARESAMVEEAFGCARSVWREKPENLWASTASGPRQDFGSSLGFATEFLFVLWTFSTGSILDYFILRQTHFIVVLCFLVFVRSTCSLLCILWCDFGRMNSSTNGGEWEAATNQKQDAISHAHLKVTWSLLVWRLLARVMVTFWDNWFNKM